MAYCVKLNGEDRLHYSNKTELVGLRKCLYYHYFSELAPHHGGKTAGIYMI